MYVDNNGVRHNCNELLEQFEADVAADGRIDLHREGVSFDADIQVLAKTIDFKFKVGVKYKLPLFLSVSFRSIERGGMSELSQAQIDR
jgi:hypothetical protein